MTFKHVVVVIALVAVVGAAFFAGKMSETSGVDKTFIVADAVASQSEDRTTSTFTLCELYTAFTVMEDAFGRFADVLDGIRCQGVDCEAAIPADLATTIALKELVAIQRAPQQYPKEGDRLKIYLGRDQCVQQPCQIAMAAVLASMGDVSDKAHSLDKALKAVQRNNPKLTIVKEYMND